MFNFLKDKLKSWISKAKEEKEEKVKTVKVKAEKEKEKPEKKEKKTEAKQKKIKTPAELEQERKISDTLIEEIKREKAMLLSGNVVAKDIATGTENETGRKREKIQQEVVAEQEKKRSFFGKIFRRKRKEEKISEKDKQTQQLDENSSQSQQQLIDKNQPDNKNRVQILASIGVNESASSGIEVSEQRKSFFDSFKKKLTEEKFDELFSELELALLQNNVALEVVEEIKKSLRFELVGKNLSEINLEEKLKKSIENVLPEKSDFIKEITKTLAVKQPVVIIFVGINGSGKTTTIAKVTQLLKKQKLSVCLGAADTFRAAAIQQLEEHASRLGVPIIKKEYGADPASVGFDAIAYAKKHHIDVVLIDTAGRMNTKDSLMKEMEKIARVCKPDMKIFIGESITGNDATEQAKAFNNSIDLSGIILSKADVDEKAGTILSVSYVTKKPIFFLGTGQTYDDLEVFEKKKVMERLGL